jgi:hypothetical protein
VKDKHSLGNRGTHYDPTGHILTITSSSQYFAWAEAIVEVAKFEEQLNKAERRLEREQKKLE